MSASVQWAFQFSPRVCHLDVHMVRHLYSCLPCSRTSHICMCRRFLFRLAAFPSESGWCLAHATVYLSRLRPALRATHRARSCLVSSRRTMVLSNPILHPLEPSCVSLSRDSCVVFEWKCSWKCSWTCLCPNPCVCLR